MSEQNLLKKRISRREMLKLVGVGAGAAALAACAPPASPAPPAQPTGAQPAPTTRPPAPKKIEITLWHGWTGADNTEMLHNKIIKSYNDTNTDGITVVPTAYAWDDLFAKWILATAAGNAADVVLYHPTETPEFVERGTVMPLEKMAEAVNWSWEGIAQPVKDFCYYKGTLYGIIEDYHPLALYYNVDLVKKAGLDPDSPPKTMDEYLKWVKTMTIRDSSGNLVQSGGGLPTSDVLARRLWQTWLAQDGASLLDAQNKPSVNNAQGKETLQFMYDWLHKDKISPVGQSAWDDFKAGKCATLAQGPWNVNAFLTAGLNFRTAPMPTCFKKPATWANSHVLSLSKTNSPDRQLAGMKFIKWFATNNLDACVNIGIIPVSPKVMEDFKKSARWVYYKAFADQSANLAYEPLIPQYSGIFSEVKPTPLFVNLQAALTGDKPIDRALTDMEKGMAEVLAQPIQK